MKFKLHDLRESKVWNEAHDGGVEEGDALRLRKTVNTLLAKRKTLEEIAELLDIPVDEIRIVANDSPTGRKFA